MQALAEYVTHSMVRTIYRRATNCVNLLAHKSLRPRRAGGSLDILQHALSSNYEED
jgi:hypothetical protein